MKSIKLKINLVLSIVLLVMIIVGSYQIYNNSENAYASTGLDLAINVKEKPESFRDANYIPNSNYFIANPYHHSNVGGESPHGVCSTVALQLLLGYHTYYTDRKLIPKSSGEKQFLDPMFGDLSCNPFIYKGDNDNDQGSVALGLKDAVFDEIVNLSTLSDVGLDQVLSCAVDGANRFLSKYTETDSPISLEFALGVNKDVIVSEINAGRPVVLGMAGKTSEGEWDFHVVTIYGYATYNGEFGYIGHWGWGFGSEQMWGPERWFAFQVTMNVEHQHNFVVSQYYTNNNEPTQYVKLV